MKKRLLMISFDAVGDQDLELLMSLPNFSRLCKRGTLVRKVSSVFITNTYPTHTTIQTGVYPRSHGIMDNTWNLPGMKKEKWRFEAKHIRVKSLVSEASRAGKTICAVLYPVTGGAPIRYHFPEIAGELPAHIRAARTFRYGRPSFVLSSLLRFGRFLRHRSPESLDRFTTGIAARTISRKSVDLAMVHLLDADGTKHIFGPGTPEVDAALRHLDDRLGDLLAAVDSSKYREEYSILIFSDHNCRRVSATIEPASILKDSGFTEQDAYFHDAGGSCFLKILAPEGSTKWKQLKDFVDVFLQKDGVKRLLTSEEMSISGADKEFTLGFAADDGYSFGEKFLGQHGYTTDLDHYFTFYLAAGADIPENRIQPEGQLIDICPLAIDMLGLAPWPTDGVNRLMTPLG